MTSRKRNPRNRGSYQKRGDNFGNSKSYFSKQQSGNSKNRSNLYVCESCGATTVPKNNYTIPTCPRCMILMSQPRTHNPNSKGGKKFRFDYAARIYYQTEGHPQYKGLPKDHPDPEDTEAVAKYKERKTHQKRSGKSPVRFEKRHPKARRGRSYQNRADHNAPTRANRKEESRVAEESTQKPSEIDSRQRSEKQKHNTENRKNRNYRADNVEKTKTHPENTRKPTETTVKKSSPRKRPRRPPKTKFVPTKVETVVSAAPTKNVGPTPKEEDYAGTALTSDRSAATILSDTLKNSNNHTKLTSDKPEGIDLQSTKTGD
ncbi:hypothetical protein K8T06_01895 [bacterium]|nr:hypothetical protein [bacterium]